MEIVLDNKTLLKCKKFAEERLKDSADLYKARGEKHLSKIQEDIITGSMAEFAVWKFLKSKSKDCSPPDLKIYKKKQKSYAADLRGEDLEVHVKSQTSEAAKRWGLSWLFQKQDPILTKPTIDDFVAFTEVNGLSVDIKAILPVELLIRQELINVPKVFSYSKTKRAVYFDEIIAAGVDLFDF